MEEVGREREKKEFQIKKLYFFFSLNLLGLLNVKCSGFWFGDLVKNFCFVCFLFNKIQFQNIITIIKQQKMRESPKANRNFSIFEIENLKQFFFLEYSNQNKNKQTNIRQTFIQSRKTHHFFRCVPSLFCNSNISKITVCCTLYVKKTSITCVSVLIIVNFFLFFCGKKCDI